MFELLLFVAFMFSAFVAGFYAGFDHAISKMKRVKSRKK